MKKVMFPIRLKVLVTVLLFLMMVVGVITATMADLFHQDKTAYVRGYSASVTADLKTEIDTILSGYTSAATVLSEVLFANYIDPDAKQQLIEPLFEAYPEILAMVTLNVHDEPVSIYNAPALQAANVDSNELLTFAPAPDDPTGSDIKVASMELSSGANFVTISLGHDFTDNRSSRRVVAIMSPQLFTRVLSRAGAFEAQLVDADGNSLTLPSANSADGTWARIVLRDFKDMGSGATGISNLTDSGVQYFAGAASTLLGDLTVVTRISVSAAYLTARQLLSDLVLAGLGIVLLASIGGAIVSRRFTKPLERLSYAVQKIAKGSFDVNVDIDSRDEIGQLSTSFNDMADELQERENSLKSAQLALVQSEKMAAVGTLSAGLAHEVKNPLSAVLGYTQLSKRKLEHPDIVRKHLDTIEHETRRCNEIIGNLMQFSRQEKGEFADVSINDIIEKSAGIVDHQLGLKNVQIQTTLAPGIPQILGNANQLQQVLMNLAINAQQAMDPDGGVVSIQSSNDKESVYVSVTDNGPGISDEVAEKIFEPFFTTKAAGQGTGLGLSVTYGIIRDHKGDIRVESAPEGGARFVIRLPINLTRELASSGRFALEQAS